jgi:suppressor for copper-sensitivity B
MNTMLWSTLRVLVPGAALWLAATGRANSQEIGPGRVAKLADSIVAVRAELRVGSDNRQGTLSVAADIQPGYHIYATTQAKPFVATRIDLDGSDRFSLSGPFKASPSPRVQRHKSIDVDLAEHEGDVIWTAPLQFAAGVEPRALTISGHLYAQACSDNRCLPPRNYAFTAQFKAEGMADSFGGPRRSSTSDASRSPTAEVLDARRPNAEGAAEVGSQAPDVPTQSNSGAQRLNFAQLGSNRPRAAGGPLLVVLATAFAAGFILNFMPCVLPVIGLKLLAFVQQAGDRRRRILALNLWYSAGVIAVFLVLATLVVFLGLSWGEQFSSVTFNIVLASVVFVFALSFLGIWEIPIPGFVGSGKTGQLAEREGATGAFSKGVLSTVLASPRSGPLLGSALTWALLQPPTIAYAGFATVGLGMASPYLLIGAFPQLVAFLPKPGAWMDTFKQTMGFVLLGTVVYLLTLVPFAYVLPTVALIIGLWAACWNIGRTPLTESLRKRLGAWVWSGAFAVSIALVSFGWLHDITESRFQRAVERAITERMKQTDAHGAAASGRANRNANELAWQPYSRTLLEKLVAQGKTVFVDFTADWCLTCKANEALALNQPEVVALVESNGVIALKADKTQSAPQVDELLALLGNKGRSIPYYAVFSAREPNTPIVLDGLFTSPQPVLDALKQAGPSREGHG